MTFPPPLHVALFPNLYEFRFRTTDTQTDRQTDKHTDRTAGRKEGKQAGIVLKDMEKAKAIQHPHCMLLLDSIANAIGRVLPDALSVTPLQRPP